MRRARGSGGYVGKSSQAAVEELLLKQTEVLDKLSSRMGLRQMDYGYGYDDYDYDEYGYDDIYGEYEAPPAMYPVGPRGRMGPRGRGFPAPYRGRGMMPGMGPGPMRFRGGGPVGRGGFGPVQGGMVDRKQSKMYLESVRKNMPKNVDSLSLYCPACSYQCKNNLDFTNHSRSNRHMNQMALVDQMSEDVRKEVYQKVQEIDKQREEHKTLMYCVTCDEELPIPYSDHKNIPMHTIRASAVKRGCVPCNIPKFKNFKEYVAHCQTENHYEMAAQDNKKLDDQMESAEELKDFPPYQEGVAYGQKYVKYSSGFLCELCKRFYYTENEAKDYHCRCKTHYNHSRTLFFQRKATSTEGEFDYGDYKPASEAKDTEEESKEESMETHE